MQNIGHHKSVINPVIFTRKALGNGIRIRVAGTTRNVRNNRMEAFYNTAFSPWNTLPCASPSCPAPAFDILTVIPYRWCYEGQTR